MQRLFSIIVFLSYLFCSLTAQERTDSIFSIEDDGGDLSVSVVTCAPGPEVYELCGHAAIRIRNEKMDSVWNYGIFDFSSPNFIYRFCKGETDYMVSGYKFSRFMPEYIRRGSKVTEQVLNLTQEEAQSLRRMLQEESLPQNRIYRYNYVLDNCATRVLKRVNEAAQREIVMPDTLFFQTFRQEMRHFHKNYPWYQFGIDLALGGGLDRKLVKDEDTFAPPVLAEKLSLASIGGEPLVKATNVIFPGYGDATLPPTPWYLTPMAVGIAMLLISIIVFWIVYAKDNFYRNSISLACNLWISFYFTMAGLAGCMLTFLVFFSEHEATSPNWLLLWLNPFQLLMGVGVWIRQLRKVVIFMAKYNVEIVVLMAAMLTVQYVKSNGLGSGDDAFVIQMVNPAIVPMLLSAIPLALTVLYKYNVIKLIKKNR